MKKVLSVLCMVALSLCLASSGFAGELIGVSMPTQSLQRWNQDGANMKAQLEQAGYRVDLQYAGDNNINFFFGGAMSVLKPFIDSGKLVVPSGQVAQAQAATVNWNTEESQKRMENLISAQGYGPNGKKLDAVLSSNDSVANGITNALLAGGYKSGNFPILTGQDCDRPSVKNIIAGTQSMSVFKDTRTLAKQVVKMVDAIVQGKEVEVNDTKTYNNGSGVIPSYLCEPVICTKDNYKQLLLDSGYYKESDLK